jgi:hypothetical protein
VALPGVLTDISCSASPWFNDHVSMIMFYLSSQLGCVLYLMYVSGLPIRRVPIHNLCEKCVTTSSPEVHSVNPNRDRIFWVWSVLISAVVVSFLIVSHSLKRSTQCSLCRMKSSSSSTPRSSVSASSSFVVLWYCGLCFCRFHNYCFAVQARPVAHSLCSRALRFVRWRKQVPPIGWSRCWCLAVMG